MHSADPEIQEIIREVLKLEQDKLYQARPDYRARLSTLLRG